MAGTLEKFSVEDMKPGDARRRWRSVLRLMQMFNALLNPKIITNSGKNDLSITESNLVLELNITGTAAAVAVNYPWQPYAAPYTGPGDAPDTQGLSMMIRPGSVNDGTRPWVPSSKGIVIAVPPNCTDGYFVWLAATLDTNGMLTALDYGYGITLPDSLAVLPTAAGSFPAVVYELLFVVTSTDKSVEYANVDQIRNTSLNLTALQTVTGLNTRCSVYWDPVERVAVE